MKLPLATARLLGLVLAIVNPTVMAQTRPTPDRAQIERRLQSVATLINESSAARQIESSGVAAARERRDNARLIHREAQTTLAAGDLEQSNKLLDQAAREMMQGARLANPEQVTGEKDKRDYELRLESARALLAAQQRITQEKFTQDKGAGREAQDAARSIEQQIAEGEKLAREGRYDAARPAIDRAYLTARVSIESLRRGDTLVRSLHFASKREEFDYEVDRNETHRMLINVLMADRKDPSGAMPPGMQAAIDKAAGLRQEADAMGKRGDHEGAIKVLEESTRELVRAIRAGGLYIPG